jgi:hypothetical protein
MALTAYHYDGRCSITALVGLTIASIDGMGKGSEEITITCEGGRRFRMWYEHDCCAGCNVEDVIGDVADLIGTPILLAEDVSNDTSLVPPKGESEYAAESETWTFVKLATVKGYVTLRWYGASNGYYSEEPSFAEIDDPA